MRFERDIRNDHSPRRLALDDARTLDVYSSNDPLPLDLNCATDSSPLDSMGSLPSSC